MRLTVKPEVRDNAMTSVLIKPHISWRLSSQISLPQRELYDEKLEVALEMLDLEWSKDDDTKTQCNRSNTSPLHRGNASNKNGPARVKQRMQWEAPSKPLAVGDPLLLPVREVHAEIGINWFLDHDIPSHPKGVCVRILAESLLWEKTPWQNKNKNYRGPHYMHGAAQRKDNCEQQLEFFTKAMVRPRTRADHGHSRGN